MRCPFVVVMIPTVCHMVSPKFLKHHRPCLIIWRATVQGMPSSAFVRQNPPGMYVDGAHISRITRYPLLQLFLLTRRWRSKNLLVCSSCFLHFTLIPVEMVDCDCTTSAIRLSWWCLCHADGTAETAIGMAFGH